MWIKILSAAVAILIVAVVVLLVRNHALEVDLISVKQENILLKEDNEADETANTALQETAKKESTILVEERELAHTRQEVKLEAVPIKEVVGIVDKGASYEAISHINSTLTKLNGLQ